ncbi:hypothetical protein [Nocardioides limicola]|uniref:hypothetical protein n=1 Tax=Nocardioides limicola TaxID=2803368 RepID=UPI00193C5BDF|nr:hypothetical protein [Nocardioides sp. DJM-14]
MTQAFRTLQVIVSAVMGTVVVLGAVVYVALGSVDPWAMPPVWVLPVVVVMGVSAALITYAMNTQLPRLDPTAPRSQTNAFGPFQANTILKMATAEMVALVALVLAFLVDEGSLLTYVVGAAISLVILATLVLPTRSVIARAEQQMDSAGGRSHLLELSGLEPWSGDHSDNPNH